MDRIEVDEVPDTHGEFCERRQRLLARVSARDVLVAGWAMAKELQTSRSLHAVSGGLPVESVESAGEMECHNLIVDDFHTFVIGKSKILVHDKTCPQPNLAVTPGLADPKLKLAAMLATLSASTAAE